MKTKNLLPIYIVTVCFALLTLTSVAQSPTWQWAKIGSGINSSENATSIAVDASGNVLVTGTFKSTTITFGTITLTNAETGSADSGDMFIVKYDAAGNVLWAKSASGSYWDYGYSVATDGSGNVLVTGSFQSSTIAFGTITLTNTGPASSNIFIVKYDAAGNVLWAKSAGGSSLDYGNSIATDVSGNILVTGHFSSPTITFGTTTLTNAGTWNMFIVKYDTNGNVLWAKSTGGSDVDEGTSVATDGSGNVMVTGYFTDSILTFGTTTLTNLGSYDMFIVKYDAAGNIIWAKGEGGSDADGANSVATDDSGNIVVTGNFYDSTITFGTTTLTNVGNDDMFIVKYDAAGNTIWVKSAGGSTDDYSNSVVTDGSGNILVTGSFQSSTIAFGTTTLTNLGSYDMFIVKYDAAGNIIWAKSAGGSSLDYANSIATDGSGNVLVTGSFFSSTISFGTITLTNASVVNSNVFIAKINTTTGIENIENSSEILLYPNPTNGLITLSLSQKLNNAAIKLINITGQMVMEKTNLAGDKFTFDILEQTKGFYFLEVKEAGSISRIKLVKN